MSLHDAIQDKNRNKLLSLLKNEMFSDEELRDAIFFIYESNQIDLMTYFLSYRSVWDLIFYFAVRVKNLELYELLLQSSNFDSLFELSPSHKSLVLNNTYNKNDLNKPDLMGVTPYHLLFWKKMIQESNLTEEYVQDKFGRLPEDYK